MRDGRFGIGEGMHLDVEEPELFARPQEPGDVTHDRLAARKPRRMPDGWRIGKLPHEIIGDERLPLGVVGDERLDVSSQEVGRDGHLNLLFTPYWPGWSCAGSLLEGGGMSDGRHSTAVDHVFASVNRRCPVGNEE